MTDDVDNSFTNNMEGNLESNENEIYYIKLGETKNKLLIKIYPKEKIKNYFYRLTYELDDFQ